MTAKKVLRWIIYLGVGALAFTPLLVADSMYFPFITGKAFYFRVIVEIVFAVWVILALFDKSVRPKFSWAGVGIVALLVISFLGVLFGVNIEDGIWSNFERMIGWITILHVAALFFAAAHTLKPKHWRWLFFLSFAVSVVVAIIGFGEIPDPDINRIDATLGNPIYLAMYTLFHAFLAGYFLLERIKRKVKQAFLDWQAYIFVILGVLNLIALYFTGTRGAFVGLLAGLFVAFVLVAIFYKRRRWVRVTAVAGVLLSLLFVGGFFAFQDSDFVQNQAVLSRFANISLEDGTAGARLDTWEMGLRGYADRPIFGWGMGNYNYVFNEYYVPQMFDDEEWFDRAHNVLVEWLVAAGPLGMLAYLSLFAGGIYLIWRRPREHDEGEETARWEFSVLQKAFLTGFLVAYLVQNLFVFDHLVSYILFVFILGWLHARGSEPREWLKPNWAWSESTKMWVGTGVAVGVLALAFFWNWPGFSQGQTLIDSLRAHSTAQQLQQNGRAQQASGQYTQALETFEEAIDYQAMGTQEARERLNAAARQTASALGASSSIAQDYFTAASREMEAQIAQEPDDLRHRMFYGDLLMAYGDYQAAVEQFASANEMSSGRKQTILFALGQAHIAAGNQDEVLEFYRQAYELDTSFRQPAVRYAAALVRSEEFTQAENILEEQFGTTTVYNAELLNAYDAVGEYEPAIRAIETELEANPQNQQLYVSLAAAYTKDGQRQEAIEVLNQAKEQFPNLSAQLDNIIEDVRAGEALQ